MRRTPRTAPPTAPAAVLVALLGAAAPAAAQAPTAPRDVADQPTAWLMYFGDHAVSRRWALHAEAQVRRAEGVLGAETWQQLLLRPGVIYTVSPNLRLTAGYAFIETWPYGEQPARARFPEHRLWQQAQLTHATGRVQWQHRYRFEQRFVSVPLAAAAGGAGGSDDVYTNRGRYLVRASVPLRGRTLAVGAPYASAYNEVFVNWGRNVQRNTFDQNRLYGALGWRLTPGTRVEAGYLQQLIAKPNGVQLERNHSLQIAVFQNSPLRR